MKNPLNVLRNRLAYYVAAIADSIIGDDPDPQPSRLDLMDGVGRNHPAVIRAAMRDEARLLGSLEDTQAGALALAKSELAKGDADLAVAVLEGFVSRESVTS